MNCPQCMSGHNVKAGFNNSKQRYKCKLCGCHFTRSIPKGEPTEKKRQAVHLYLEGLGFRAIGRLLNVSHVTAQVWVAKAAERLEQLVPLYPARAEMIELDEMHHYVGKKNNTLWVWVAVAHRRCKALATQVGCRGTKTASKLWSKVNHIPVKWGIATDHYAVYPKLLVGSLHLASKALTHTVEGTNSRIRHYLARFHRRTKCYSKSVRRVEQSLLLFQYKGRGVYD